MAAKRERSDDFESSKKRARSDAWVQYATEQCELFDYDGEVVFIDGFFRDFPNYSRVERDHPKSGMSLCTQYLFWLHPNASFSVSLATYNQFIDIRERNGELYFFKAPGFFYFGNNGVVPDRLAFHPQEYDIDHCVQHGAFDDTTMQVIAFYYLKILPQRFKERLYVHKTAIQIPFFDGSNFEQVDALTEQLRTFIAATPDDFMGVALIGYTEHAMALVFEAREKRLELYEPNGVSAKYRRDSKTPGPVQSFTMYEYLTEHVFEMQEGRITNIWGNTFKFQQRDGSCSLWASTMAICRMSQISRDRLPTNTQDVIDITAMNRKLMWAVCGFDRLPAGPIALDVMDRALNNCHVPKDRADQLLGLVMKHAKYSPIPIPRVEFVTDDDVKSEGETCPRPLVVNLQQVDVTRYFAKYISTYCEPGTLVVRGKSLSDSSFALRLMLRTQMLIVQLDMSELINLSDVDTVRNLERLFGENANFMFAVDTGVVYASNTVDVLAKIGDRLWFDRLIVARPMSDEARAILSKMAGALVDEPKPWVLRVNLLNDEAVSRVFSLPPGSVDSLMCNAPLVGQEPSDYGLHMSYRLRHLMRIGVRVEVSSVDVAAIVDACGNATVGHTLHATEVGASPTVDDRVHVLTVSHCIKKGVLSMDRLVLKLRPGANVFRNFAVAFAKEHPLVPIYMVLDPVDEHTLQVAADLGVSNFIVDYKYASEQPVNLIAFLNQAKSVEYRELQKNL